MNTDHMKMAADEKLQKVYSLYLLVLHILVSVGHVLSGSKHEYKNLGCLITDKDLHAETKDLLSEFDLTWETVIVHLKSIIVLISDHETQSVERVLFIARNVIKRRLM